VSAVGGAAGGATANVPIATAAESEVRTAVGGSRTRFHPLTIARIDPLCSGDGAAAAVTLVVPVELATEFDFRAGQWLTVRRFVDGREERRSYSLCSPAGDPPRIGVREVLGGAVSRWLIRVLRPGDVVEVQAPSGSFTPDVSTGGRHALIGAGSGITPLLSIAATLLGQPDSEVVLLYGNRHAHSVMFADEIADLKDAHPTRFQLNHVLSREPQEVELFSGRMDKSKLRSLLPATTAVASVDHWWLCGPLGMIVDAVEVLSELGVNPDRIHRELFYVGEPPPEVEHPEDVAAPGAVTQVTVMLDGRTSTTPIPRTSTVLEGAQRVRPDLPFACKGGVCGTCRARVTAGQVRMRRNFALEKAELEASFVLTCQSVPVTDELTVDFDS